MDDEKIKGLTMLQALFRGCRSRDIHVKRAKSGAKIVCPFMPSNSSIIESVIELSDMKKLDVVLDIGSGDGEIIINLARKIGVRCTGVEIDEILCLASIRKIKKLHLESYIDIILEDAIHTNFFLYSVVTIFLVPSCLKALSPILKEKCPKGTKIVNIKYPLPLEDGWIPVKTLLSEDAVKPGTLCNIFLYIV